MMRRCWRAARMPWRRCASRRSRMISGPGGPSLLRHGRSLNSGEVIHIAPDGSHWRFIDFRILRLPAGASIGGDTGEREVLIVIISGAVDVATSEQTWRGIGRVDPFSLPT